MLQKKCSRYSILPVLTTALIGLSMPAHSMDGISITGGAWEDGDDRYGARISPRWLWQKPLYSGDSLTIKGYWEGSLAYWRADNAERNENDNLWVVAAGPMFQLHFNQRVLGMVPYFELGIGVSAMTDDSLGGRKLGSWYHFEDKVGFGLSKPGRSKSLEFGYRYYHYSNASIKAPNDGLDFHTLNLTVLF